MAQLKTVRCPNCGQKTSGTDCQWCGYPMAKGRPTGQKEAGPIVKETKEKARKDVEAKSVKLLAEAVGTKSAKLLAEAEQKSAYIVKQAEQTAKQITDKARMQAEQESTRIIAEAKQKAQEEVSKVITEAKKEAERMAKEAADRVKKGSEESSRAIAEAKRKAEQIIKDAKEKARREAEHIIKGAKRGAEVPGEETEKKAEAEVPPTTPVTAQQAEVSEVVAEAEVISTEEDSGLYQGKVELEIVSPTDFAEVMKLQQHLYQVPDLHVVSVGGSTEGTRIIVSAEKPIPLVQILREMPPVKQALKKGDKIQVSLRTD